MSRPYVERPVEARRVDARVLSVDDDDADLQRGWDYDDVLLKGRDHF